MQTNNKKINSEIKFGITEEGFSMHTFELTKELTYEDYRRIKNSVYERELPDCYELKPDVFYIGTFHDSGINVYMHSYKNFPPSISAIINFKYLGGIGDATEIFTYGDDGVRSSIKLANMSLSVIDEMLQFNNMTLNRVDLCVNVELEDADETQSILRLIKKTRVPQKYTLRSFKDKDVDKRSFCIYNGSVAFKVYDKIFQVFHEGYDKYCDKLNPNRGLLRFELTLERRKINEIAERSGINNETEILLDYLCANSELIMKNYICMLFPSGSYCRYGIAEKIIEKCPKKKKLRKRMLYFLIKVSECKSINRAMELTAEKFDLNYKKIYKVLDSFEEIGLNPVTLKNSDFEYAKQGIRVMLGYEKAVDLAELVKAPTITKI
jgi:hypothetical protein